MFEFKVLGLSEASVEIEKQWPTKVISLVSPNLPIETQDDHLVLRVADVHTEDGDNYPEMWMIDQIMEYADTIDSEDRVLVHCFAGQSRSTAAMIGVLLHHGLPWQEAFDAVIENRDVALPNQLIIRLLDERFGFEGELIRHNAAYVSKKLREESDFMKNAPEGAGVSEAQAAAMRQIMNLFD